MKFKLKDRVALDTASNRMHGGLAMVREGAICQSY